MTAGVLLMVSCGAGPEPGSHTGRPLVVATTTQVADFVRHIGGADVDVYQVLKANVDPHDFEPSPADLDAMSRAALVVESGVHIEAWLQSARRSAGTSAPLVDSSTGVKVRKGTGEERRSGDPHIWQDPRNAAVMCRNIETGARSGRPVAPGGVRQATGVVRHPVGHPRRGHRGAHRPTAQQEARHQPRRLRLLHRPLRPGVRGLHHPELRHVGRAVGERCLTGRRHHQGPGSEGGVLRELAATQDRRGHRGAGRA